uniref:Uncharacterized protein n=1 Tax=Rhizophora mucronata TaxID=61149 RepID=A0A2P2J175_RHIMU
MIWGFEVLLLIPIYFLATWSFTFWCQNEGFSVLFQ